MIDYAYPMMMAEKALKEAHNRLLDKKFDAAIDELIVAITETRLALNATKHMKEQHDALRKQTEAI